MTDDKPAPDDPDDDGSAPTEQPTVSSTGSTTARKQQTRALVEHEKRRAFWSSLLRDDTGRREIWNLLHLRLHTFNPDFPTGPAGVPDQFCAWYHRGQQDFGLALYHDLLALDFDGVRMMHVEHDPRFAPPKPPRRKRAE